MKIRYARNNIFLVHFESASRNEMEQVTDEIYFPVGSLHDVP